MALIARAIAEAIQSSTRNASIVPLPDLTATLPKLFSKKSTAEALEWVNNIESQGNISHWSDEILLKVARRKMVRGARNWLLMQKEVSTWTNFKDVFREAFVGGHKTTVIDGSVFSDGRKRTKWLASTLRRNYV